MTGEEDPSDQRSLAAQPKRERLLVLMAGPVTNLLLAIVLFSIAFLSGIPEPTDTRVTILKVSSGSPAAEANLQPGDIMFSRKNWYMSNVGLPGFWPHAILYIGSPAKFDACFDNDRVKSYLKTLTGKDTTLAEYLAQKHPVRWLRYRTGKDGMPYRVIEGIKPGIVLNTLKGCSGDYMAAIRPRLDKKAKAQAIIEAFGHLDKPYDYDFDFATDHALVCTELIWRSYRPAVGKDGLNLPLVEMGGRKTLPALDIVKLFAAEHGIEDRQFDFVYFLDAKEKSEQTFVSTEAEFLKTITRAKWSFALD